MTGIHRYPEGGSSNWRKVMKLKDPGDIAVEISANRKRRKNKTLSALLSDKHRYIDGAGKAMYGKFIIRIVS
jgi:hypothetical protein